MFRKPIASKFFGSNSLHCTSILWQKCCWTKCFVMWQLKDICNFAEGFDILLKKPGTFFTYVTKIRQFLCLQGFALFWANNEFIIIDNILWQIIFEITNLIKIRRFLVSSGFCTRLKKQRVCNFKSFFDNILCRFIFGIRNVKL